MNIKNIKFNIFTNRKNMHKLYYAYFIGLFEGLGFFSISKKGKYLTYELGIELSIKDVQLIYKIKDLLGVGVVNLKKKEIKWYL